MAIDEIREALLQPTDEPLLAQIRIPRGVIPAIAAGVALIASVALGYNAGQFFGFVLIPQAFAVKVVVLIAVVGYVGLSRPWWSRLAALKWPVAARLRTRTSPAAVFLIGTVVAGPAATYLGVALWATGRYGSDAWQGDLASLRLWAALAAPAIAAVMVVAWRICFAPPARAWVRWVPLAVLGIGAIVGVVSQPTIGVLTASHYLTCGLAVGWGLLLGIATPERLGLTPAPRVVVTRFAEPQLATRRAFARETAAAEVSRARNRVSEAPRAGERPRVVERPRVAEQPSVVERPRVAEQPRAEEAPRAAEQRREPTTAESSTVRTLPTRRELRAKRTAAERASESPTQ